MLVARLRVIPRRPQLVEILSLSKMFDKRIPTGISSGQRPTQWAVVSPPAKMEISPLMGAVRRVSDWESNLEGPKVAVVS